MIKKLFLLSSFSAIFLATKAQSIISTESFDNTAFAPAGWVLKPNTGTTSTQSLWVRSTTSTFPTVNPHSGAGMARFRSRSGVAGNKQQMATRTLDYTNRGTNAANLTFWMYRDNQNTNLDSIAIYVNNTDSIDGNAVKIGVVARNRSYALPDTQATNGWYSYTFSVPVTFTGNMTTRFIFEGSCENVLGANQGANTTIDDLSFDEFPIPCTGIPNVGSIVNSVNIICGGSGIANLSLSTPISGAGITYTWAESMSSTGPWTTFGSNTNTATTNNLTSNTYFQCIVSCSTSGLTFTTPTDSIVVSSNPVPIILVTPSPASFCAGTSGVAISASGANAYFWTPALGLDTTQGANVLAAPIANTQYVVQGIDTNGCVNTTTVNVIIANSPNISFTTLPSASVCAGSQVIINPVQGGGTNGNTYLWSDGKTSRRDTVIVNTTMTLSVTVTNQGGCSSTDSITITALPAQNSGFKYLQTGSTFAFTDTTIGSISWFWDFGDGNSSLNQNPTYTYSLPGTYVVTLIVEGPCKIDTITQTVTIYPLGISTLNHATLDFCYPNPASKTLSIELNHDKIQHIEIINMLGKTIRENSFTNLNKFETILIDELPTGIYVIRVEGVERQYVMKFSKQ